MNVLSRSKRSAILIVLTSAVVASVCLVRYTRAIYPRRPILFVQTPNDINTLAYSRDGKLLIATDTASGLVTFRDSTTGQLVRQWYGDVARDWFAMPQHVWLSNDGSRMIESDDDRGESPVSSLRDITSGRTIRSWDGQVDQVSPDFSRVITSNDESAVPNHNVQRRGTATTCRVVDVVTGAVIGSFVSDTPWKMHVSKLGDYLCVPRYNRPSLLLRLSDMTSVLPLPPLVDMTMSSDDRHLVAINSSGQICSWSLSSGKEEIISSGLSDLQWVYNVADGIGIFGIHNPGMDSHEQFQVRSPDGLAVRYTVDSWAIKVSQNGNEVVSCDYPEAEGGAAIVRVFDAQTGRIKYTINPITNSLGRVQKFDQDFAMSGFAIAPDGNRFAYGTSDGLLKLFDANRNVLPVSSGPVVEAYGHQAQMSPNELDDTMLKRPTSIPSQMEAGGGCYVVYSLQTSNDGRMAAVVWNGVKTTTIKGKKTLENSGEQAIDLRDVKTGTVLKTLLARGMPGYESGFWAGYWSKPSISRDGRYVAVALAGDTGGKTLIWDAQSGRVVGKLSYTCGLPEDTEGNYCLHLVSTPPTLAFSPDGRFLAVARDDGSIYLYSLKSDLPVAELCSPVKRNPADDYNIINPVQNLKFDPNGKELYGEREGTSGILAFDVPKIDG